MDGDRWGGIVADSLTEGMRLEVATSGWAAARLVAAAGSETTVAAWLEPAEDDVEGLAEVLALAVALGSDRIAHAGLAHAGLAHAGLAWAGARAAPPRARPGGRWLGPGWALAIEVVDATGDPLRRRAWRHPVEEAGGRPRLARGGEVPPGRSPVAAGLAGAVGLVEARGTPPTVAERVARCRARGHDLLVTDPLAARLLAEAVAPP